MATLQRLTTDTNQPCLTNLGISIFLLVLLVSGIGCGNKPVSVSGIIRLNGKPLNAAGVVFHPKDGGCIASSVTDADGRYRLETGNAVTIKPGKYCVTVSKDRMLGGNKTGLAMPGQIRIEHLSPIKYNSITTSPLQITLSPGSQTHDFELTSDNVLP